MKKRQPLKGLEKDTDNEKLDQLGRLLEEHIRFEEREWFQALQYSGVLSSSD